MKNLKLLGKALLLLLFFVVAVPVLYILLIFTIPIDLFFKEPLSIVRFHKDIMRITFKDIMYLIESGE